MELKLNAQLYFCNHCKKVLPKLEDLLFVEEGSPRGFCGETCIEKFYTPLIHHFEKVEASLRKDLGLNNELILVKAEEPDLIEELLHNPDEVWQLKNDLHEELYAFVLRKQDEEGPYFLISVNYVFNQTASFVFLLTATRNKTLLSEFQIGQPAEINLTAGEMVGPDLNAETMLELERKKSQYLAILIEQSLPGDISEDQYELYIDYYQMTLEHPDEVYRFEDEDGDIIFSYIASFQREGMSFFYVCLFWAPEEVELALESGSEAILPITSFPTINGDLVRFFRKGEQISGVIRS